MFYLLMYKFYLCKVVFIKVDLFNIKFCLVEWVFVDIYYCYKRMFFSVCFIEYGFGRGKIFGCYFKFKKVCILFLWLMVLKIVCVLWFLLFCLLNKLVCFYLFWLVLVVVKYYF